MKKLTSHDQEIIASLIYVHQLNLHKLYKEVFIKPNMNFIRNEVTNWLPIDPQYKPINPEYLPKRGPKAK
jgi:hypothetical protein